MDLRDFAFSVIHRLRRNGYQALLAGGCVRDLVRGVEPQDFDVATDATPDQVQAVFGKRRTVAVGKAFGVIVVLDDDSRQNVEVATFRKDAEYLDGRHPSGVEFSTPEEDARRRDFTINGLFFDPESQQVVDYVGGIQDIHDRLVRAIGVPADRIEEDKLRMLRAVRFAAVFDFRLDPATAEAIRHKAPELSIVSAERTAQELAKMFNGQHRGRALQLLEHSGLWPEVFPELRLELLSWRESSPEPNPWEFASRLESAELATTLALLVRVFAQNNPPLVDPASAIGQLSERLRLSNRERDLAAWLVTNGETAWHAISAPWPMVQRLLIHEHVGELLALAAVPIPPDFLPSPSVEFCRTKLQLPRWTLNPPPLLNGHDLLRHGLAAGPIFKLVLDGVRDAQLEGRIRERDEALDLARQLIAEHSKGPSER